MRFDKMLNHSLKRQEPQQPIALASVLIISVILFITNLFTGTTETLNQKLLGPAEIQNVNTFPENKIFKRVNPLIADIEKKEPVNEEFVKSAISVYKEPDSSASEENKILGSSDYKPVQTKKESNKFSIHIESYMTLNKSLQRVEELKRKGFNAFYTETNIPGKGKWFRILIGGYNNSADALKELEQLKRKGMFDFAEILNSESNQSQTVLKQ